MQPRYHEALPRVRIISSATEVLITWIVVLSFSDICYLSVVTCKGEALVGCSVVRKKRKGKKIVPRCYSERILTLT